MFFQILLSNILFKIIVHQNLEMGLSLVILVLEKIRGDFISFPRLQCLKAIGIIYSLLVLSNSLVTLPGHVSFAGL